MVYMYAKHWTNPQTGLRSDPRGIRLHKRSGHLCWAKLCYVVTHTQRNVTTTVFLVAAMKRAIFTKIAVKISVMWAALSILLFQVAVQMPLFVTRIPLHLPAMGMPMMNAMENLANKYIYLSNSQISHSTNYNLLFPGLRP